MRVLALALVTALAACVQTRQAVPTLASARVVSDFDSYKVHRVGVMPVVGAALSPERSAQLQGALFAEFSAATSYEIRSLSGADLAEIQPVDPHRQGWYSPRTILDLAHRYQLDALLIATVTDLQPFPPQRLALQVDLVSCETGQTLWAAAVQLDASQSRVRSSMEVWAREELGDVNENGWEIVVVSPRRFARFAAYQLASLI